MQNPTIDAQPLNASLNPVNFSRLRRWSRLVFSFLVGQGSVQALNLITGFFLLRWMSVEAYAQYSVAFSFQSMLNWLVDLGAAGSIVALVGDRRNDKEVIGKYIRSAKYFRVRLLCLAVPISAIIFLLVVSKHHWPWTLKVLLFSSIIAAQFFQGVASFYSTPQLINQKLGRYFRPQIIGSIWRLLICFILKLSSSLFAWTTAWVSTSAIAIHSYFFRAEAKHLVIEPKKSDPNANKEMLHYLIPTIPWIVFTAFQGQISLFLIAWFGQTRNVAEVAALGRLGQLFLILMVANSVVIGPYIASVPQNKLLGRYVQILGVAFGIASILCTVAFLFPQPLLWVLGPKYENLSREIGWAVAGACAWYIGSVMLAMHNARKWIYWWWSAAHVVVLLITQIFCLCILDLTTTLHVLYFSLITNIAALLVVLLVGFYGFLYGPPSSLVVTDSDLSQTLS